MTDYAAALEAYIRATREGNAEAYVKCVDPDATFYGSLTGVKLHGRAQIQGVFQAGAAMLGFQHIRAFHVYGHGPEVALVTPIQRPQDPEPFDFVTLIRFNEQGLAWDLRLLWDPRRVLLDTGGREAPPVRAGITAFYEAFNRGDDQAILDMATPDIRYFGSLIGSASIGLAPIRAILRSARDTVGIAGLQPRSVFGRDDHLAVLTAFQGRDGHVGEGVFGFTFDAQGHIQELSAFWDPRPFLRT